MPDLEALFDSVGNYAAIAFFAASSWGTGRLILRSRAAPAGSVNSWAALQTTAGVGVYIVLFQVLAILGAFNAISVTLALVAGAAATATMAPSAWRTWHKARELNPPLKKAERLLLLLLILLALPLAVAPLTPPAAYDELMYHLPYAREVAQSGGLGIYEWLRYPWFPYNLNLLYAAALLLGSDVLPHFVNAMTGALSAWILYELGTRHADRATGLIAAAIWLCLGDYSNALIDMGVGLFILGGCAALSDWCWESAKASTRPLALAAFLFGVAVGCKYQALTFMPLVAGFVLWHERRARPLTIAFACFLLPCIYWYGRNALLTGDPFNPIGAPLFGFTNWNHVDYANQVLDVRAHSGAPNGLVWTAVLAPLSAIFWKSSALRAAAAVCLWSLAIWLLTSGYPRYLMPVYPLLALMAALGWRVVLQWMSGLAARIPFTAGSVAQVRSLQPWLAASAIMMGAGLSVYWTTVKVRQAALSPVAREAFLRAKVPGYAVMDYLRTRAHGEVYQVALSEAIYYGPSPVWGDTLGPWRYADFLLLPASAMARKLQAAGFGTIVIATPYLALLSDKPGFGTYFTLLFEKDGAKAFRIETHPQ